MSNPAMALYAVPTHAYPRRAAPPRLIEEELREVDAESTKKNYPMSRVWK